MKDKIVTELLFPIWRGIDKDFKSQYAKNIWDIFEANVRSCASSANLPQFLERIKSKMKVSIHNKYNKQIIDFIDQSDDAEVLSTMHSETSYLIIKTNIINEQNKQP